MKAEKIMDVWIRNFFAPPRAMRQKKNFAKKVMAHSTEETRKFSQHLARNAEGKKMTGAEVGGLGGPADSHPPGPRGPKP